MKNHFDLFHLPQRFAIDGAALDAAYHEVQNQVHPDKFSNATDSEKRVAMQWATRANEAYQTLKSPFKRAAYLCELNGVDLQTESNTAMPREFLMQQMEWREALEDAKSISSMEEIALEVNQSGRDQLSKIEHSIDFEKNFLAAAQEVRSLMFIERFASEVDHQLDLLGQ